VVVLLWLALVEALDVTATLFVDEDCWCPPTNQSFPVGFKLEFPSPIVLPFLLLSFFVGNVK
jgi:hypothetical protein